LRRVPARSTGEVARPVRERHEDLPPLTLPLGHGLFHQRDADAMALGYQQLVEPCRRELLLAAGPPAGLGQQRLHARTHRVPHRSRARLRLPSHRHRLRQVLLHRQPREPQLLRNLPLRPAFHQHLVTNDMDLIHSQHPPSGPEAHASGNRLLRSPGGSLSERRVDHFPGGAPTMCHPLDMDLSGERHLGRRWFDWTHDGYEAETPDEDDPSQRSVAGEWVAYHGVKVKVAGVIASA
jgi:hypothetical protein